MLILRRTKIERAGIVVSAISLLAIVLGTLALGPNTTSSGVTDERPQVIFDQTPGESKRKCVEQTTAEEAKSPGGVGQGDWFSGPTPQQLCGMAGTSAVPRSLTLSEYVRAYAASIASAATEKGVGEETISGPVSSRMVVRTIASRDWLGAANFLLYWGVRFLLIGLFSVFLFEATVGRLIRFVWHGSARA